jgi:hypothetical protein
LCDRLKRTFEFAADQLNKNCVAEAAAVLFPFEISDQVVVGKADAVVVTVAVEDLFETFRGGERVLASLAAGSACASGLWPNAAVDAVSSYWPTRHQVFICTRTSFSTEALRRFVAAFVMSPVHMLAFVLLPDMLSVSDQAAAADVLSALAPALLCRRVTSKRLVLVLGSSKHPSSERLAFVLGEHLLASQHRLRCPSSASLSALLQHLCETRNVQVTCKWFLIFLQRVVISQPLCPLLAHHFICML